MPFGCGAVHDSVMAAWLHPYKPSCVSQELKVRPDAAVWNALIAAAGRAGQLQRAFEALQDMQVQSRLCSGSYILLCNFGLFLCILLASSTKHALSLSAARQYGKIVMYWCMYRTVHIIAGTLKQTKTEGVYAFQHSQWEPPEAAAQSQVHRP